MVYNAGASFLKKQLELNAGNAYNRYIDMGSLYTMEDAARVFRFEAKHNKVLVAT